MKRLSLLLLFLALYLGDVCQVSRAAGSFDPTTGTIIDKRWQSGLPLGGIGVGKIELMTDGSFGNFTNQHNWDRPYRWARGAFAAIRVQADGGQAVTRMLRLRSDDEYAGVENIAHTRMQGWFPRAQIDYEDPALPIKVQLNAFSPLIPHDIKDSGLPVACLSYVLTNSTDHRVQATLALAWPNLLGWGGRGGVEWNDLSGDSQSEAQTGALAGLRYTTTQSYSDQQQNVVGEDFVGVRKDSGIQIEDCAAWDTSAATPSFWPSFVATGSLPAGDNGSQPAGAVAASVTLRPGETRTLHFYVVWAMPNLLMVDHIQTFTESFDSAPAQIPSITNQSDNRWTTNRSMIAGDHLVIDLGRSYLPTALKINSGKAHSDYPRGLKVEASNDGTTWETVAIKSADDMYDATSVPLSPMPARYLRLTNLGPTQGLFWSIYGLAVQVQDQEALVEPAGATSYLLHADISVENSQAGTYWQNWRRGALDIASYVDQNSDQLLAQTRSWQDPVLKSNMPFWLKLKLINCAFPMFSNTVLTKKGQFSILESPIEMGGALGTMDQRMAAHAFLTAFFPELDRTELEQYAACQQPDGSITHFDGNVHEVVVDGNVGYGITGWPDLSCGWVSQVVKLYRWTGDRSFLARVQPHIDRAMNWLQADGTDDDLIPTGGSTYDYEAMPHGAFIYSASCYLGALRAASAVASTAEQARYNRLIAAVQKSVMKNLWTGAYFRKWRQPSSGKSIDDSFIANMAGDWFTRISGLPSTLDPKIVRQSMAQTIARHQKPFFPIPPMQVTPDGNATTDTSYTLQDEPYLGCEAIYNNYVDDGLETIRRIYFAVWEENESPWDESLCYDAPNGRKGGLPTYMTCPTTWFVLDALAGASLDIPDSRLYLSPRLTTGEQELHIPVYFSRFWGWLDYAPARRRLTLTVTRVFTPDSRVERSLYHLAGDTRDEMPATVVIRSVAANGNAHPFSLGAPFVVREGAVLDLSPHIDQLGIPAKSDVVDFEVKPPVHRLGLPADNWKLYDNLHDNQEVAALVGQDALDGNPDTRWTTGRSLEPGDAVTLDMAAPQKAAKLVLDSAKSPGDYPAGYRLEASIDGKTWTQVAQATEAQTEAALQGGVLTIAFPPITARYLRVTSQGGHSLWWSIHELYVFGP